MMKFIYILTFLIVLSLNFDTLEGDPGDFNPPLNGDGNTESVYTPEAVTLYGDLKGELDNLPLNVFEAGYSGYKKLLAENLIRNKNILTIIDF
ncbi:MAG TPA: hypothetical protein VE870_01500, partial [Bacteroidales bacterium]|nr:hypothetical protein [Bacteroidales bacterium]